MEGLGLNAFINPQRREMSVGQHFTRFIGLGLNNPQAADNQFVTFETGVNLMPEVSTTTCPQIIGQNLVIDSNLGNTNDATCGSYTPSNSVQPGFTTQAVPSEVRRTNYCDRCDKQFQFEDMLAEHLRAFHKVAKPYCCHICHETFRQKFSVDAHLRKEHNFDIPIKKSKIQKLDDGTYACDLCSSTYPKLSKAYSHRLRHFHKRHVCPHCEASFYEYKNLKKHLTIHDKPTSIAGTKLKTEKRKIGVQRVRLRNENLLRVKKVFCAECNKGFHNNYSLNLHVKINHQGIKPFSCDLCNLSFCVKRSLHLHKFKKHNVKPLERIIRKKLPKPAFENPKKHLCEICSKQYSSKYQFRLHRKTHFGETGLSFPCFLCEECFQERETMTEHMREVHNLRDSNLKMPKKGENGLYTCEDPECQKTFVRAHDYFEHRQECHGDKRFVCPFCSKAFTKTTLFRTHLNTHTGVKPHVCLVCKISFSSRTNLNLHMKVHFKMNPFYCAACNKTFATDEMFKDHRTFHEGKSPFMCEKCYRGFKEKDQLEKHELWGHRELQKNFLCKFCNHTFVSKCTLNKHLKSFCKSVDASTINRNICQFCGRNYKHYTTLRSHLKTCELNVNHELPEELSSTTRKSPRVTKNSTKTIPDDVENIAITEAFICKCCFLTFVNKNVLFKHVEREHPELNVANEVILGLYDKNQMPDFNLPNEYLSKQIADDTDSKNIQIMYRIIKYLCNVCNIPYASKNLFVRHVEKFHPNYKEMVTNDTIPLKLETKDNSQQEEIVSEESNQESADDENKKPSKNGRKTCRKSSRIMKQKEKKPDFSSCPYCGTRYVSKSALDRHVAKLHPNESQPDVESDSSFDDGGDYDISKKSSQGSTKASQGSTKASQGSTKASQGSTKASQGSTKASQGSTKASQGSTKASESSTKVEHKCKLCKIVYTKMHYLDKHIAKYHPDYNDPNPKSFIANSGVETSNKEEVKTCDTFRCAICKVTYSRRHNLEKHITKMHTKEILDETSQSEFNPGDYIESTEQNTTSHQDLECEICDEKYKVQGFLDAHIRKNHSEFWESYVKKKTQEAEQTKEPVDSESEEVTCEYFCKICRMPYNLKKNLDRHVTKFHPDYYQLYPEDKIVEIVEQNVDDIQTPSEKPDILQQLRDEISKDLVEDNPTPNIANDVVYTSHGTCAQYSVNVNYSNSSYATQTTNYNNYTQGIFSSQNFHSVQNVDKSGIINSNQRVVVVPQPVTTAFNYNNYQGNNFNQGAYQANYNQINDSNAAKNDEETSDQDDYIVPESGFEVNYDSDDCDDPKVINDQKLESEQNIDEDKTASTFLEVFNSSASLNTPLIKPISTPRKKQIDEQPQIKITEKEKAKGFFCKICPMYYLRKIYLKNHYSKEHPDETALLDELMKELESEGHIKLNSKFTCDICKKDFTRKEFLIRHHKSLHIGERNFVCQICNAAYKCKSNLQRHHEHHIKNPFHCEKCNDCFKTAELLEEHYDKIHVNGIKCNFCEKQVCDEKRLKLHVQKKHPNAAKEVKSNLDDKDKKVSGAVKGKKGKKGVKTKSKDKKNPSDDSETDEPTDKCNKRKIKCIDDMILRLSTESDDSHGAKTEIVENIRPKRLRKMKSK